MDRFAGRELVGCAVALFVAINSIASSEAWAQNGSPELYTDTQSGIIYKKVTRTIPKTVVDRRVEKRSQLVYRPETVMQTTPEVKTTYVPITEYKWRPYVHGRWNIFRQPLVAYHQTPETRWEARSEVINRTSAQTRWVAEQRTVEVPHEIVRIENEQRVEYQPYAYSRPLPSTAPPASGVPANAANTAVASRLRPLNPVSPTVASLPAAAVASNTVGLATSDPPRRNSMQSGMRTNVLLPSNPAASPLGVPQTGTAIATVPSFSMRR